MAHETIHTDGTQDPMNVTNPEHAQRHIVRPLQYTYVFGTLLLFTGITIGVAYIDLKWANPVIALGIACFQATIGILFFMHVAYQSRLIKITIGVGFFLFLVLVTMTMGDYVSRAWGMW